MKNIPIVFCFDDNLALPAAICLTSLLENAKKDTFYDIFILHGNTCHFPKNQYLRKLNEKYHNFNITYRNVGMAFSSAFQIREITQATYYRLLIPELVPEYDKIMYHDVDVIFRNDLSDIFHQTIMEDEYVAGVVSPVSLDQRLNSRIRSIGVNPHDYISAGNIILHSAKIREDGILDHFKREVLTSKYEFQDMDIINIVCKGKIKKMPPAFCGTIEVFRLASYANGNQSFYSDQELAAVLDNGIIHYNGPKPWKEYCPNFDIWWEYYRRSIFFDSKWYFNFYRSKLDDLDRLSFWKRLKLLFRYFKVRKK